MNPCNDITLYSYQDLELYIYEKGNTGEALLRVVNGTNSITTVEVKYEIAKRIIERHISPKVQMDEFGIKPDKVRCNDGRELFERGNVSPVCVKPQTFEKLVQRGLDIGRYQI